MPELSRDPKAYPQTIVSDRRMSENLTGNWRSLRPVIDTQRCTGCLICWKFCPEACVGLTDKVPLIDLAYCKGCGICVQECPPKAMTLLAESGL